MNKVNTHAMPEEAASAKGNQGAYGKDVSIALGREPDSTDLLKRHPFDVEISRIPPGNANTPFHSHSGQWEFYHVLAGTGKVRDREGTTPIEAGDAFVFKPNKPHQIINDSTADLIVYVVADNPLSESAYLPDEGAWIVRSPKFATVRSVEDKGLDSED